MDALAFLEARNNGEQVASLRIPVRAEHPYKALRRLADTGCQPFEAYGGIDVVAEEDLARSNVTLQ